jgi:flavin reductase (DIM6/NTAB) family NADH-FMN oxidoreductase RutF
MKKKSLGAKPLIFPAPVFVVGSYDKDGKPNVMTAAWGGLCCSQPPCVAVSMRKATQTYGNIMARRGFTISIPSEAHIRQADYFGLVSGNAEDKFAATGLTPVRSELVDAPYVGEFGMILECKLAHSYDLGLHTQFVGYILDIKADPSFLKPDGSVDIAKLLPVTFMPDSQMYHGIGPAIGKAFQIGKSAK